MIKASSFAFIVLLILCSCAPKKETAVTARIRRFYSSYIVDRHGNALQQFSRDTLAMYFTSSFLKNLPSLSEKCDCDPIIQGQDYDKEWVKNLSVVSLAGVGTEKKIRVCFEGHKKYCLIVTLKKEGDWKIDNVTDDTK